MGKKLIKSNKKKHRPTGMMLEGRGIQFYRGRGYPKGYQRCKYNFPSIVNKNLQFRNATLRLMAKWKIKRKKYSGIYSRKAVEEKRKGFQWLANGLSEIYNIPEPKVVAGKMNARSWKRRRLPKSSYEPETHSIEMNGDFSTAVLLHEFAHARNFDEMDATIWSYNLLERIFKMKKKKQEK